MSPEYDMFSEDWAPGEVLAEDSSGAKLRELTDHLLEGRRKIKTALDKGVSPEEYEKGTAMIAAYASAIAGLELAWKKRHG